MFESYELYTKNSEKNRGRYGLPIIDKEFILVIKATRDFIDEYVIDMKYREFSLDEILHSLTNDSIVDSSSYADPERDVASIPASDVEATLILCSDQMTDFEEPIEWLNYRLALEC